jgi:hypothetical protein
MNEEVRTIASATGSQFSPYSAVAQAVKAATRSPRLVDDMTEDFWLGGDDGGDDHPLGWALL